MATGPIIAAFDIGSNTIKMTVGQPDGHGGVDILHMGTDTVRLSLGVERTGRLADDRIKAALASLTHLAAKARDLGATRLIGVATAATRSAANGPEFLDQVRSGIGIDVRVIDGDEEADLTFRGLAAGIDISGQIVVADIGGASTELILALDGTVQFATSVKMGSGALTERLVHTDPPTAAEIDSCRAAAREDVSAAREDVLSSGFHRGAGPARLVVVGGTGEFLVRLLPPGSTLDRDEIDAVLDRLLRTRSADIARELDIPEARARVLPAGVAIVRTLADELHPNAIEVSQSGIRTGLLLDAFAANDRTTAN